MDGTTTRADSVSQWRRSRGVAVPASACMHICLVVIPHSAEPLDALRPDRLIALTCCPSPAPGRVGQHVAIGMATERSGTTRLKVYLRRA